MKVRQLRAFLAVAQTLSFAQACERLHLSQSALSLSIKALEESLGGPLFHRTTRSVRLTPEGESLLPLASRLIADWDNARDEVRQRFTLQKGRVSIAAMPSFAGNILPKVLRQFRQEHPNISVVIHDVVNESVMEMVQTGSVEIGIGFAPPPAFSLAFDQLFVDEFLAAVPKDSELAGFQAITWDMLLKERFITLQRPSGVRFLLETSLKSEGKELPVEIECHQLATVGRLVAEGLGVSAVPALCRLQMEEAGAICIPLSRPEIKKPVGSIYKASHELSTAASAFLKSLNAYRF